MKCIERHRHYRSRGTTMPILKNRVMNTSLQRYSALLALYLYFGGNSRRLRPDGDSASLTNAGRAEYWAGHFEEAERLLRSALEAALRTKDDHAVAAAYNDLGAVYQNEERLIEAERAYSEALRIFRPNTLIKTMNGGGAPQLGIGLLGQPAGLRRTPGSRRSFEAAQKEHTGRTGASRATSKHPGHGVLQAGEDE